MLFQMAPQIGNNLNSVRRYDRRKKGELFALNIYLDIFFFIIKFKTIELVKVSI